MCYAPMLVGYPVVAVEQKKQVIVGVVKTCFVIMTSLLILGGERSVRDTLRSVQSRLAINI